MWWRLALVIAFIFIAAYLAYYAYGSQSKSPLINFPMSNDTGSFVLSVAAFADGGAIPAAYTCDGAGGSPALAWSGAPAGTKSFALVVDDPDVPKQLRPDGLFVHWVLYNIPTDAHGIPEGGSAGESGLNGRGAEGWTPPCPPREYEPSEHRYVFTLYALDTELSFAIPPGKDELMAAMEGHTLASAQHVGRYKRQ